jgi:hypothetical protein
MRFGRPLTAEIPKSIAPARCADRSSVRGKAHNGSRTASAPMDAMVSVGRKKIYLINRNTSQLR